MRHTLTRRQGDTLKFIRLYTREKGESPTFADIASGLGLASTAPAFALVTRLEERGYIKRLPGRARSITLIPENGDEMAGLRVIRDAANAFVNLQERFRRDYDAGLATDDAQKMGARVAGAFDDLRCLVRGGK